MVNTTEQDSKKVDKRYEVSLYDEELIETTRKKKNIRHGEERPALFYLGYVGQIGFVIALPIAGGTGLGAYLDAKWHTYPKLTMIGLVLGLGISIVNFIAVIKEIIAGGKK